MQEQVEALKLECADLQEKIKVKKEANQAEEKKEDWTRLIIEWFIAQENSGNSRNYWITLTKPPNLIKENRICK